MIAKGKKGKRILSVLLACVLVFSLFSSMYVASAEEAGPSSSPVSPPAADESAAFTGQGTVGEPFQITSKEDLVKMRDKINGGYAYKSGLVDEIKYGDSYYELTQDIDLSGENWVSIGRSPQGISDQNPFNGSFDGKGHKITNLSANHIGSSKYYTTGLFGVNLGTIKNLFVEDANMVGDFFVAILCVRNRGTIENCGVTGQLRANYSAGTFVAANSGGTIKNCYTSAKFTNTPGNAYGVFYGSNNDYLKSEEPIETIPSVIENCYYLAGSNGNNTVVEGQLESFTEEDLTSGAIAYKLAKGNDIWEQELKVDNYPVLDTDSDKKTVFAVDFYLGDNEDNLLESQYGNNGATISKPEFEPVDIGGYDIGEKWYKDAAHDQEFTFEYETISADTKLYSEKKAIEYNITYNLNDGEPTVPNKNTYTVEDEFTLNNPEKEGYTFKAWTGTGIVGEGTDTVKVEKGSTGDRTYYAHYVDDKAPSVTVKIGEDHTWDYFQNHPEADTFFNSAQKVTVEANDAADDDPTIEYLIFETGSTEFNYTTEELEEALKDSSDYGWQAYDADNGFTLDIVTADTVTYVVVVKVTDDSGNVAYVSTSGLVFDLESPVLNRVNERVGEGTNQVTEGNTYCVQLRFTVTEDNLNEIKVDDVAASAGDDGIYTVTGNGSHKIEVTDKAGNNTTVNFTVADHVQGEPVETPVTAPDCDDEGLANVHIACTNCGQVLSNSQKTLPATGHKWHVDDTTDSDGWARLPMPGTCDDQNVMGRTCDTCGMQETKGADPLAHDWETNPDGTDKYTVDQKPTCTVAGSESVHCKNCAATRDARTLTTIDHVRGSAKRVDYVAASCTTNGGYDLVRSCTMCGTEMSRSHTTLYAKGHDFTGVDWEIDEPKDTCEDTGTLRRQCKNCTYVEFQNLDATAHTPETDENGDELWTVIDAPTCTENGMKGVYCSVCGALIKSESMDPEGHTLPESFTRKNIVQATCTEPGGYDDVWVCTVCSQEVSSTHTTTDPTGHNYTEWKDIDMPSCEDDGTQQRECLTCGFKETRGASATGHDWYSDYTVDMEPTCTLEGSKSIHCRNCAATMDPQTIPANGHTWITGTVQVTTGDKIKEYETDADGWFTIESPTCTGTGTRQRECAICHFQDRDTLDYKGHTFNTETTVVEPSCTTDGVSYRECSVCGVRINIETIPALGHDWNDWYTVVSPDCDDEGTQQRACKRCNASETVGLKAAGHDWMKDSEGNYIYTTDLEPTCTTDGSKSVHCSKCTARIDSTPIPMLGHEYGEWETVELGDCTVVGRQRRSCQRCGTQEYNGILDENAHTWNDYFTEDVPASCTTDGSESIHCSKCGGTKESRVIPATGHSWSEWQIVEMQSCEDNNTQMRVCSKCQLTETEGINPRAHEWEDDYTIDLPASCTEDGSMSIHCKNCLARMDQKSIPATGHTFGDWYKAPAGSETAETTNTWKRDCEVCGFSQIEGLDESKHIFDEEWTIDVEPTCTTDGSRSRHCLGNCGVTTDSEAIPALGHDFDVTGEKTVIQPATCTEDGIKAYKCSRCDEYLEPETIAALGHDWDTDYTVDKEPTCTSEGSQSIHCTRCDAIKEGSEVAIEMNGHTFGRWHALSAPDCENEGAMMRECEVCGYKETKGINPLGHNWEENFTVDVEATCLTDGSMSIHCTRCDAVKESVVIKARGYHVPVTTGAKEATCTENGYTGDTVCQDCKTILQKGEVIPAKGHNYENGVCTVCGAEQTSPNTGAALAVLGSLMALLFIGFAVLVFAARKRRSFQK